MDDELDKLIVKKEQKIDTVLIFNLLKNFLRIVDDGRILFDPKFNKLKQNDKILVYLLARKIIKIKKFGDIKSESCGPAEINKNTKVPLGSAKRGVQELKDILEKDEKGYFIPNYNISKIKISYLDDSNKKGGIKNE